MRGSGEVNALTSNSRSKLSRPCDCSAVKPLLRNSRNAMAPDPPLVLEQPLELLEEVAVVADEHDVGVAVTDGAQGALDRDVDDLDVGVAGERDGLEARAP